MARVAFCQNVMVEQMGVMCLSAILKDAGHTTEVFFDDERHPDRFMKELVDFKPDIIAFSILTPSVPWALRLAQRVKRDMGAITVLGNVHAIVCPEIIEEPGVDIVCLGEGEFPMRDLCGRIDAGEDYSTIDGFWVKTGTGIVKNPMCAELVDLDAMPFHDRPLYDKYAFFRHSHYVRLTIGRGCPFRCTFCTNPVLADKYGRKRYVRKLSPERAIAEIEHTIRSRPEKVNYVFFADEVFWVTNAWLREFCTLYKERIRIPFSAAFRFGPIAEEDVQLMAEAGCTAVSFAFETGDEQQRRELMNKNVSDELILQLSSLLRKHKIRRCATAFFGLPGDTFDDHIQRLAFYREVNPTYLWTTFFQPYPGVALSESPDVKKNLPQIKEFAATLHSDMYLDVPDRARLVALKKVYFLCMKLPWLEPFLVRLTRYRIPLLFDFLFFLHFTYYAFVFERVSPIQWLVHLKVFAINPLLRKHRVLQNTGESYEPPQEGSGKRAGKD